MNKYLFKFVSAVASLMLLASCGSGDGDVTSDIASKNTSSSKTSTAVASSQDSASLEVLSDDPVSSAASGVTSSNNQSSKSPKVTSKPTVSSAVSSKPIERTSDLTYERYPGTRDPFYWPFSDGSIWNMPIGSNAKLQKANFKDAYCMSIDDEYIVKVPQGSPYVDVYQPSAWNQRWPGKGASLGKMQIPSNFILADAQGNSTPNNCAAFVMPDGRTIKQLEPCCRTSTSTMRIVGWLYSKDIDIYGDGIGGSHYGSGLSAIGGSIRKGELTSSEPIKHAIKLNVWAKSYLYYDYNTRQGYVWPADRNDSYAASGNNKYNGSNPNLRMGTLLTIPKNVTEQSLGLTTEVGKKLFYALQNYGCYIADDSAWDCYAWSAEDGVRNEVESKYHISLNTNRNNKDSYYYDSQKLITNLYIVTNNSPSSIGGGGTPCKPLAPAFK